MSTDQPALSDFVQPDHEETHADRVDKYREIILEDGAVYGRDRSSDHDAPTPERSCLRCGASIETDTSRVVGDNDGNVEVCKRCWLTPNGGSYRNTTSAVTTYRGGAGQPHPDVGGEE
jgi:hypothetical protein